MLRKKKQRKPDYERIEQLDHELGLADGTFSDEWVADIQRRLDEAKIPPRRKEFFTPPILGKKPQPLITNSSVAMTSTSLEPCAVWHVERTDLTQILAAHGLHNSGFASGVILPNG